MTFPRYEILCLSFSVADPQNGSINLGFIPRSGHTLGLVFLWHGSFLVHKGRIVLRDNDRYNVHLCIGVL